MSFDSEQQQQPSPAGDRLNERRLLSRVEKTSRDLAGTKQHLGRNLHAPAEDFYIDPGFPAKLTGQYGYTNSWGWKEQIADFSTATGWKDLTDGRTGTAGGTDAAMNMLPIPASTNDIVWMHVEYDCNGDLRYSFRAASKLIPGKATKTGGAAGSIGTNCSWVYTVYDLSGRELGTSMTPQVARIPKAVYQTPADNGACLYYYDESGTLCLYDVAGERPAGTQIDVVTGGEWDSTAKGIQLLSTSVTVLAAGTEVDGSFIAFSPCPPT